METVDYLLEVITETDRLLADLFTSGFLSAHNSTLEEMDKISETCIQCGLTFAGENLKVLSEEIKGNKHRITQNFEQAAGVYCNLNRYISLCKQKLSLEECMQSMKTDNELV
jgi:hypothetical protein